MFKFINIYFNQQNLIYNNIFRLILKLTFIKLVMLRLWISLLYQSLENLTVYKNFLQCLPYFDSLIFKFAELFLNCLIAKELFFSYTLKFINTYIMEFGKLIVYCLILNKINV